ncbi:MAG: hypothetical protein ACQERC_02040 [Bacteroidota bacterium]
MKLNAIRLVLALFVGVLVLESCKKGENDPFLSLRSRDNRITGEWELTKYDSESTTTVSDGSNTVTTTTTTTFEDDIWTTMQDGNTSSISYSRTLTMKKDGTYTMKETEDGEVSESGGRWSWLDDAKKKRRVLLDNEGVFYIDQLKHKEMIFTNETNSSEQDGGTTESTTSSSTTVYQRID